jgi:FAD:protein FMN transferase
MSAMKTANHLLLAFVLTPLLVCAADVTAPVDNGTALRRFEFTQPKMATTFRIVLFAPDEAAARKASDAAFARMDALNAIFSDYSAGSELSRLCEQSGGPAVHVSDELFDMLEVSRAAAERSGGAFDVTLGPLIKLWRLSKYQKTIPLPERISAAKELSGIALMHLDRDAHTVRLEKKGMRLDVGGLAKGYAADAALKVLCDAGLTHALVAAGGDIRAGDPPPGASGWRVGVAPQDDPERTPSLFLSLANAAVSTSGDAEQHVVIDGVRYAHIVDPKTGLGMHCRRSVTVVAPNGTTSDWMDTAVYVMGRERGMKMIEETPNVAALWVDKTDAGTETIESERWKKLPRAP